MSWKAEVTTSGDDGKWSSNRLVFATEQEARGYASDLALRWRAVVDWRAVDAGDAPVNALWGEKGLVHL